MNRRTRLISRWVGAISILSIVLCIVFFEGARRWKNWERESRLSHVPEDLSVSKILYVEEAVYGFGPGGNENGVIMYELSDEVANQVKREGINYFNKLTSFSPNRYE